VTTSANNHGHHGIRRLAVGLVTAGSLLVAITGCADKDKPNEGTVADGQSSTAEVQPVTVTGTALPKFTAVQGDTAVGQDAPKLDGFDFAGKPVTIDYSQGPTMVVFLAHWCPHCNAEIPVLLKWKNSGQMPANLKVVGVSSDVRPTSAHYPPSKWLPGMGWSWPSIADSAEMTAFKAFGQGGFPFFVVVGTDGKVKLRNSGEIPANQLSPMINAALNG